MKVEPYCEAKGCKEKRLSNSAAAFFLAIGSVIVAAVILTKQFAKLQPILTNLSFEPHMHIYVMIAFMVVALVLPVAIAQVDKFKTWGGALVFGATLPGTAIAAAILLAGD